VVQHVPVPFVDTPLTSNVREAVERDWSTNLNGPAVRVERVSQLGAAGKIEALVKVVRGQGTVVGALSGQKLVLN
jgi:hypothetical protein